MEQQVESQRLASCKFVYIRSLWVSLRTARLLRRRGQPNWEHDVRTRYMMNRPLDPRIGAEARIARVHGCHRGGLGRKAVR